MEQYLQSTRYFDATNPQVVAQAHALAGDATDPLEIARRLYLGVRDGVRYNPYTFSDDPLSFSGSHCLAAGQSYCIPKAVLLGTMARALGIPSRLGLADVRNHLSSPQLLAFLRSDVFVMHGYIELWLNERWVKATPAFNKALCERMGVAVLEFDGEQDSMFQPFDEQGRAHMEYLKDHGTFADVPVDFIVAQVAEAYPHLVKTADFAERSLEGDIAAPMS